ncbi:MAG: hypothetical protein NTV34_19210 [Proteobacteria bacterium]|nr:hypothetical protein [Pseudomonadota bacterium]
MADNSAKNLNQNRSNQAGDPFHLNASPVPFSLDLDSENRAGRPLSPRKNSENAHDPLSSPGAEPLLPGDDLSMFFRNRAVIAGSVGSYKKLIVTMMSLFLLAAAFIFAYNSKPKFRVLADKQAKIWLNINLADYVPAFKGRTKKTKSAVERDIERNNSLLRKGRALEPLKEILIDPLAQLIRAGRWKEVEPKIQGKCLAWVGSYDCLLKGYYLASRGLAKSVRPMTLVEDASLRSLKLSEQVLWHHTVALVLGEADIGHKRLSKALAMVPANSFDLRRMIFDDLIVNCSVTKRGQDLKYILDLANKDPGIKFWNGAAAKWNALSTLTLTGALSSRAMDDLIKGERGSLKNDPRSIELLGIGFIRSGRADRFLAISMDAMADLPLSRMDADLQRRVISTHLRVLWALGRRGEAGAFLNRYQAMAGRDALVVHYQAASILQNGDAAQSARTLAVLGRSPRNLPWETQFIQGYALVRSGQPSLAHPIIRQMSKAQGGQAIKTWTKILTGEFLLSQKRYQDAERLMLPHVSGSVMSLFAAEILRKAYDAQSRDKDAMRLRLMIDDVRAKTGYWSSPEMLSSPLGPLAVIR